MIIDKQSKTTCRILPSSPLPSGERKGVRGNTIE